jgi:hypothetical protein
MAAQEQPAPDGGGGAGSPGQQVPAAPTGEIHYTYEAQDITGERKAGSENHSLGNVQPNDLDVPFDTAKTFQPKYDQVYKPIFDEFVKQGLKAAKSKITYQDNFNINLHSHYLPVPVPLQLFVTDINWSFSTDDPYCSCDIVLKMPFSTATDIFCDDQGKMSPGQYIYVSTDPAQLALQKDDDGKIKDPEAYFVNASLTKGIFLGVVSNISTSQTVDDSGLIIHTFNLTANSFIHNLQMGQYFVDPVNQFDSHKETSKPNIFGVRQNVHSLFTNGSSVPFALSPEDWSVITKIINDLANSGTFDYQGVVKVAARLDLPDSNPEFAESTQQLLESIGATGGVSSLQDLAQTFGVRRDISGAIFFIIMMLGYPTLPGTLRLEPYNTESFYSLFYKGGSGATMEDLIARFYKDLSVKEFDIKSNWLQKFMRAVGNVVGVSSQTVQNLVGGPQLPGALIDQQARERERGLAVSEIARFADYQDITEARFIDRIKANKTLELEPERLGNFIRVASCKNDLPPSCSLRDTLPDLPPVIKTISTVQNVNEMNQTIWGLIKGTFHFDEAMYELYPVLVPIHEGDYSTDFEWNHRGYLNPLHTNMGAIPYVIFRQKPMFPGSGITKNEINENVKKFNTNYFVNVPYYPITYQTASERIGINTYKESPPIATLLANVIPSRDIKSISQQYTDLKRLNAVRIKNPLETQQTTGTVQNISDASPIVDGMNCLRHGLRMYTGIYPFVYKNIVKEVVEKDGAGNITTVRKSIAYDRITTEIMQAYAERFFMTYGYENNSAMGAARLRYQKDVNIYPGMWLLLNTQDVPLDIKETIYSTDGLYPGDQKKLEVYLSNLFVCYVTDVSHSFSTLPNGNVIAETNISFERGVYGLHPNVLPQFTLSNDKGETKVDGRRRVPPGEDSVLKIIEAAAQRDGLEKASDVKPKSAAGGQPQEGEEEKFSAANRKIQKLTRDRLLSSGAITREYYETLTERDDLPTDAMEFYWELQQENLLYDNEEEGGSHALRILDYTQRLAELQVGEWVTEDFATRCQARITGLRPTDPNPIPRALWRAYSQRQKDYERQYDYIPVAIRPKQPYNPDMWKLAETGAGASPQEQE